MFIDEDKSSGSHHSTSKPKPKKKKNSVVSRNEFLELKSTIDQILPTVFNNQPLQTPALATLQSLEERVLAIETKQKFTSDHILIHIDMGISQLDVQLYQDHKQFIKQAEELLKYVKDLNDQLVKVTIKQEEKKKYLINETHKAYEDGYAELHSTIRDLRR